MADILSGITEGSQSQLDLLVDAFRSTQKLKVNQLQAKKSGLETKRNFFNGLNSKISSLISYIDKLKANNANTNFESRKVTSSDASFLSATATSASSFDSITAKVDRLASKDTLISNRVATADAFGFAEGSYSFDITIGGKTKTVNVALDGTENYENGMKKIATAINSTTDVGVKAAFVKDSSTTGKLSFSSNSTGSDNKITFTDSPLLAAIGLDSTTLGSNAATRTLATATTAGYKQADASTLDSQLTVNGIQITRSSNTITDAIDGITFNLLKSQDASAGELTLTNEVNLDSVKSFIEPILNSINELTAFVQGNASLRRSDSSISNLYGEIRSLFSQDLNPNATGTDPKLMPDLGIITDRNGKLTLNDTEKLKKLLVNDPSKVAEMFTGANGLASKLSKIIQPFDGENGLIKSRTSNLNTQIDQTTKRTNELNDRIETQATALRKQYIGYMNALYDAQNQSTLMSTYSANTSGYNSLLF